MALVKPPRYMTRPDTNGLSNPTAAGWALKSKGAIKLKIVEMGALIEAAENDNRHDLAKAAYQARIELRQLLRFLAD